MTFFEDFVFPDQPSACPQCAAETDPARPFCDRCKFDLRHGSLRDRRKGQCIYCERFDKLSEEHIFPKWIQGVFPKRHRSTTHTLTRPENYGDLTSAPVHKAATTKRADPYDATVRNVCEACNNGWMSQLQTIARPFVESLARGNVFVPSPDERTAIARWVVMTSINLQCYARQLVATQAQRTELMQGNMPSGWRVAMGSMAVTEFAGLSLSRSMLSPIQLGPEQYTPAQMSLFVIERALFQTFSTLFDRLLPHAIDYSGAGEQAIPMQPIWPLERKWDGAGYTLTRDDLARIPGLLERA